MNALEVESLSKRYRLGGVKENQYKTIRDSLSRLARFSRRSKAQRNEVWALRDVSFEVAEGEALGIIGRNGAGKSTLLKILSRITEPTSGRARLRGRVASLLEVGTGFHPELTGRENVYLNGSILGMSSAEIRRDFDAIVAFAEIDKFLDTPVKRYSSGMYVRLAFAVAAHLTPEILIVDEVLSVGDAEFQRRCLGKMSEVANSGRTVLFVSHNLPTVAKLCDRVAWIDAGKLLTLSEASSSIAAYLRSGLAKGSRWEPAAPAADSPFRFHSVIVRSSDETVGEGLLPADRPIQIEIEYTISSKLSPGRLALKISDQSGMPVLTSSDTDRSTALLRPWTIGRWQERCTIPGHWLSPGRYFVSVSEPLAEGGDRILENVLSFEIGRETSLVALDGRLGMLAPFLEWDLQKTPTEVFT